MSNNLLPLIPSLPPTQRVSSLPNAISSVTFISSYAPRQCGIATFTQDLRDAMLVAQPLMKAGVAVMAHDDCGSLHPAEVTHVVIEHERAGYAALRDKLNASGVAAVSLQHEYGIFGGPDGSWILDTLRGLQVPVVTTCHTVLADPSPGQRMVLAEVARLSVRIVVMAERGRDLLRDVYDVPQSKIAIIPHGIPDTDPAEIDRETVREDLGIAGCKVLLTTGLLSPNKGLHHVIQALPRIVARHPDVIYVIAGATHPNLVRTEGEAYREGLQAMAEELGVAANVRLINRFASRDELVRLIVAADLFMTPYLNDAQITSGVLAYASGLGKPVISTAYWHARELLDENRGTLVPFGSPNAIADAVMTLLDDSPRLQRMSVAARDLGRHTIWRNVGQRYLALLDEARAQHLPSILRRTAAEPSEPVKLDHLHRLTGPLGIYQHATFETPNLEHGYCTDDNARALITIQDLLRTGHPDEKLLPLRRRCFTFVRDAFDESSCRFRNFRSADDEWCDGPPSEDCHGRALWALGHTARYVEDSAVRSEAISLFVHGLQAVNRFTSPRAWAFTLLGLGALRSVAAGVEIITEMQSRLAARLLKMYHNTANVDWRWFEDVLSYDNARLPQSLLVTAAQNGDRLMQQVALDSLKWLMRWQQAPEYHFRAIGSDRVFKRGDAAPAQWDQQPLEAQASLAACLEAYRVSGNRRWLALARNTYAWFDGTNDLSLPVGDARTGACFDGVQSNRLNQNCGAESTLAYLQACADMRLPLPMPNIGRRATHSDANDPVVVSSDFQ